MKYIIAILLLIIIFAAGWYSIKKGGEEQILSTDTTLFTPYMTAWTSTYLDAVKCESEGYYTAQNNTLCYDCNEYDACFGYAFVSRDGKELINPLGKPYLIGRYGIEKQLNLDTLGFFDMFDCSVEKTNQEFICRDGIKLIAGNKSIFEFPSEEDLHNEFNKMDCLFYNLSRYVTYICGVVGNSIISNKIVSIGVFI